MDREVVRAQVLASRCVVTVLDTETFTTEQVLSPLSPTPLTPSHTLSHPLTAFHSLPKQVVFENQVAADAGIPIIPFFDADTYRWQDVSHWTQEHEAFFKIPAVEYHRR